MQTKSTHTGAGFTLVHYDITVPTGTVMLHRESDLPDVAGKLPPRRLVSDGRKQVIDPGVLQPLYTKRKQVLRLLDEQGTPFFGGHLVPPQNIAATVATLDKIEAEYQALIDEIAGRLPAEHRLWAEKNPEWSGLFRENELTEAEFRNRCGFRIAMMEIVAPNAPQAAKAFATATAAIVPQFLAELAHRASRAWDTHAKGKGKMTQVGLQAIRDIVSRLKAFALLDPRVGPSAAGYEAMLVAMPKVGPLNPRETAQAHALLGQLMEPERILVHGAATLDATPGAFLPDVEATAESDDDDAPDEPLAVIDAPPKGVARCGTQAAAAAKPDPTPVPRRPVSPTPAPSASTQDWSGSF
jgi:hypothetical protein